jgi:hypothetical protein
MSKYTLYLTIPSFEDIEKSLDQHVIGRFVYHNIHISYDFISAFSELEVEPKFPIKLKLGAYYVINRNISESSVIEIKVNIFT